MLVQLLLQQLPLTDLLAFARCDRRVYQLADSAFVFKHASLSLTVSSVLANPPQFCRWLRHIRLCLVWSAAEQGAKCLAALAQLESVHELVCMRRYTDLAVWTAICSRASTQSIRWLQCNERGSELKTNSAFVAVLATLPMLSTLQLHPGGRDVANFFSSLAHLPALTCLTTSSPEAKHVSLVPLSCCPMLSELHLQSPLFEGDEFVELFTAPTHLHTLSLDHVDGAESLAVSGSDWLAAFSSMRDLTRLRLTNFAAIDLILPHVAAAASLRWLECAVELGPIWSFEQSGAVPSAGVIAELCSTRPSLSCTLSLRWAGVLFSQLLDEDRETFALLFRRYKESATLLAFHDRFCVTAVEC